MLNHSHPCLNQSKGCTNTVSCTGTWERNIDGFPEAVCDLFHNPDGSTDPLPCEPCQDSECDRCGAMLRVEPHLGRCPEHPDNVEPPDPFEDVEFPFAANH